MKNALDEILLAIDDKQIAYGRICLIRDFNKPMFDFCFNSSEEFRDGSRVLDVEYDSGYGGQELFGHVVFTDGTWVDRGEYDGSEWWRYNTCPDKDAVFLKEYYWTEEE